MKIFLTGDTHIPLDTKKLNTKNFPAQKRMNRNDYLIVLGDFGLLWQENETYHWWKDWFETRKFTTLWIDGNHDNHSWIDSLPVSQWNGGKVHVVSDNIIHLMRGQVYTLAKKTFFTYGGALSIDKFLRTPGIDWWYREEGNYAEQNEALDNLEKHDNKIDYILTHTCPGDIVNPMFNLKSDNSTTERFLNRVAQTVTFGGWYFGHMHSDKDMGNYHALYQDIRRIV